MTGPIRIRRRPARLIPLLTAVLIVAGCSGIPASGTAQDVRPIEQPNAAEPQTVVQAGLPPDSIVRDFISHATDTSQDTKAFNSLAVARQYLTQDAAKNWHPDTAQVVVLRNDFRVEIGTKNTVVLKGTEVATLGGDRAYHAVADQAYERTIQLTKVSGQWRISDPPGALLVTESDFQTSYLRRVVYFLNRTGTVLVPDPRYVTLGPTPANRADRLVRMLLAGPSSGLTDASGSVTSQLGDKADLRSAVTIEENLVRVDLTGVEVSGASAKAALAAQLAWTLQSEGDVVITINGEPLDPQVPSYSTTTTASFSPDRTPGSGNLPLDPYYVDAAGRIISLGRNPGKAMWGRLGTSGTVVSASMSAANGTLAAVSRTDTGQALLLGKPLEYQNATRVLTADSLTTPTFDRAGNEVWVVQDGAGKPQVIRMSTGTPDPPRQVVDAPGLAGKGVVTAFVLSPDGVRVAVVADGKLYVGVISTTVADQNGPATVAVTGLTEIDPQLTDVGPIAFRSAEQLVVGAKVGGTVSGFRLLYQVYVDGGGEVTPVSDSGIVGDVEAVAIGPNGVMLTAFDGRVYQLDGSVNSGEWVSPDPQSAVLAGSAPFVPN